MLKDMSEEEILEFLEDNLCEKIMWLTKDDETAIKKNVYILSSPGVHVIVIDKNRKSMMIIPWDRVIEIHRPYREKSVKISLLNDKLQIKNFINMAQHDTDDRSFG